MAEQASSSSSKAAPPPPQSSSSSAGPRRRQSAQGNPPSPRPGILRRQSTQDRINDIIETGLERAETLHQRSPQLYPLSRGQSAPVRGIMDHDSSADETTGIMMGGRGGRARHVNYSSTLQDHSGPRARRTPTNPSRNNSGLSPVLPPPAVGTSGADGGAAVNGDTDRRDGADVASQGLWQRIWANFQSIELENKGSVARDHLALERTFLAWLRTSLAFASIGVAITQLFRLNTSFAGGNPASGGRDTLRQVGKPLGVTFLAISILMLFLGYRRYFTSQKWIMKGKFPASRGTVILVTLVAFALMVSSLIVVVVVQPHSVES